MRYSFSDLINFAKSYEACWGFVQVPLSDTLLFSGILPDLRRCGCRNFHRQQLFFELFQSLRAPGFLQMVPFDYKG
jgi:hypothetical protein